MTQRRIKASITEAQWSQLVQLTAALSLKYKTPLTVTKVIRALIEAGAKSPESIIITERD